MARYLRTYLPRLIILVGSILLVSCGGGSGNPAPTTSPGTPTLPTPAGAEGSVQNPVFVPLNTPRNSSTGSAFSPSYYAFVTNALGTYVISLTNPTADVSWNLYSDSGFTNQLTSCDNYFSVTAESCASNLQASTTYYLKVSEFSLGSGTFTLTVRQIASEGTTAVPVDLTVGTPYTGSVGLSGVSYYRFLTSSAAAHTVTIGGSVGMLFSASTTIKVYATPFTSVTPTLLKTCGPMSNPTCTVNGLSSGTYYYVEVDGNASSGVQFDIAVTQGVSEGSVALPVNLVVGDPAHNGAADGSGSSYYRFTTSAAGEYIVTLGGTTGALAYIYSDAAFTTSVGLCSPNQSCSLFGLDPMRTYYVRVANTTASPITYQIAVAQGVTEGSVASPFALIVGAAAHSATIDASGVAYYKFQTTAFSGSYTIGLTGTQKNLGWTLYSDAAFSMAVSSCNTITTAGAGDEVCVTTNLDPNKNYYLKVSNNESTGASAYNIAVAAGGGSEGSLNFPLQISGLTHNGMVTSGQGTSSSYYSFTTGAKALTYVISLSNMQTDLGWQLFSTPDFSSINTILSCNSNSGTATETCSTQDAQTTSVSVPALKVLNANTAYYLRVDNPTAATSSFTLTLAPLDPAAGCGAGATQCFSFEDGIVPPSFVQTSTANGNQWKWVIDGTNPAGSGTKSLRSGTLGFPNSACVAYTPLTKPSSVTFSLQTDTVSEFSLTVLDGSTSASLGAWYWAGAAVPWRRVTMSTGALAGATHTFKWCFNRNSSTTFGTETVRIDDIEFR